MDLYAKIKEIDALSEILERQTDETNTRRSVENQLAKEPKRKAAISSKAFDFNEEGAETRLAGTESVHVPVSLPSREVAWRLRNADAHGRIHYRVFIEVDGPAIVTAYGDAGKKTMDGRRVSRFGVFDIDGGEARLVSTEPILRIKVLRYTRRAEGEIILGPFECNGLVRATAIGHGDFTATVASNHVLPFTIHESEGILNLVPNLQEAVWTGGMPRYSRPTTEPISGTPWDIAHLFNPSVQSPEWGTSVVAGRVFQEAFPARVQSYQNVTQEISSGKTAYWGALRQWTVLSPSSAPNMDPVLGYWTFVWGSIEYTPEAGVVEAYDITTGRKADPTQPGRYIVKAQDPEFVTVDGIYGYAGEPLRKQSDPLASPFVPTYYDKGNQLRLRPGVYHKIQYELAPKGVLVRVRGRGILRSIELEIEDSSLSPDGSVTTRTHREDLSNYWAPADAPRTVPRKTGPGVFVLAPRT